MKQQSALLRGITSKHHGDLIVCIAVILPQQKANFNRIEGVKIKIFVT